MERNREGYEHLKEKAAAAATEDEIIEKDVTGNWSSEHLNYKLAGRAHQLLRRVLGQDEAGARKKIQAYINENHAEANEFNEEYDRLIAAGKQAQDDLQEYFQAHSPSRAELIQNKATEQLRERVESAYKALEAFRINKLGLPPTEQGASENAA